MAANPAFPTRPGGNFGAVGGGVLQVMPDLRAQMTRARDMRGRFTSLQTPVREAHYKMGLEASRYIGRELQKRISATGRVQRAPGTGGVLVDLFFTGRVVDASADTFVVGGKLLDESPARAYFRNLETGTRIFVGREIGGAFRSLEGQFYGPSRDRYRADPRLIQFGPTFGARAGNMQSTIKRGDSTGETAKGGVLNRRGFRIVIRKPIPAYRYIEVGGQNYLASGHVLRTYRQVLEAHGIKVVWK